MLLCVLVTVCALAVTGYMAQHVNPCEELRNCTTSLAVFDFTAGMPLTRMNAPNGPSAALDALCGEVQTAHTCVENVTDNCHRRVQRDASRSILEIGDYFCNPDNRDDMEELFRSECVTNETVQTRFVSQVEGCMTIFVRDMKALAIAQYQNRHLQASPDISAYCRSHHELENCLVRVSSTECGEVVGQFVNTAWDIATQYFMPPELRTCFTDVQATRRALEQVVPTMAKRHFEELNWLLGDLD